MMFVVGGMAAAGMARSFARKAAAGLMGLAVGGLIAVLISTGVLMAHPMYLVFIGLMVVAALAAFHNPRRLQRDTVSNEEK